MCKQSLHPSMVELEEREVLGKEFRIYGDKENPLFLAKDVATWIYYGISNVSKMVKNIDEEEKIITRTNKKTTIKFRIDENMKRDFLKLCKIKESTMSKELKRFIESELEVERIIKANNKVVRLKYEK